MVVVEDSKKGDIVVKDVLEGLCIVGEPNGETVLKKDVVVGIDNDDIRNWPLTRVVARLNNFRVPVNSTVRITFSRKMLIREEKPDLANDDAANDEDNAPIIMEPPQSCDDNNNGANDNDPVIISQPPSSSEGADQVAIPTGQEYGGRRTSTSMGRRASLDQVNPAFEEEMRQVRMRNEDLEVELSRVNEALTLSQAKLGSLERQVEAAEFTARENAERAQHAEVEFQRVLLSTEEYHQARRDQHLEPAVTPATSAKTLKEARTRAIAAVAASDPTGNMLRKWEREGDSAEDKLKR